MNYLDLIILTVVGIFVARGLNKGLIKSVGGVIGFVASLIIATAMVGTLANIMTDFLGINIGVSYLISYILLFVGLIFVFKFVVHIFEKMFEITLLTMWVNKAGGGFLGFLMGSLLVSSVLVFLAFFPFTDRLLPEKENSFLYPYAHQFFPVTYDVFSRITPATQRFNEILEDMLKSEPIESLKNYQAGRDLLEYWDEINENAKDRFGLGKK